MNTNWFAIIKAGGCVLAWACWYKLINKLPTIQIHTMYTLLLKIFWHVAK